MTQKQLYAIGGVLALLLLLIGGYFFFLAPSATPASQASLPPERIVATDRTLGSASAKVTVIEYGALTCPVCAGFNNDIFPQFKEKYIDTGKVYYVYRLFPIDQADPKAEKIARCLPADMYFQFTDMLYRKQDEWGPEQMGERLQGTPPQPKTEAGLIRMAAIAGMGSDKATQCMTGTAEDARINKVAGEGDARYHIGGTPTFVINGVAQPAGPIGWDKLQVLLDAELAKKK